jgi:hypothetical protein
MAATPEIRNCSFLAAAQLTRWLFREVLRVPACKTLTSPPDLDPVLGFRNRLKARYDLRCRVRFTYLDPIGEVLLVKNAIADHGHCQIMPPISPAS